MVGTCHHLAIFLTNQIHTRGKNPIFLRTDVKVSSELLRHWCCLRFCLIFNQHIQPIITESSVVIKYKRTKWNFAFHLHISVHDVKLVSRSFCGRYLLYKVKVNRVRDVQIILTFSKVFCNNFLLFTQNKEMRLDFYVNHGKRPYPVW